MRVMVLVKASADSEAGALPDPAMFEAMGRYNQELAEAGLLLAAEGLKPTAQGWRIRCDGDARHATQGPFAPAGEQVAGFWLWQVRDMDEALAWARRCPNPMPGPSDIEIRPVFELSDFADAISPDTAADEQALRARVEKR